MNITHAVNEEVTGDKLLAIFNRQKELMEKYHDIEARSGLLQTNDCPVNLHDKRGQARLKDFAWRVTEEVGEALDALCIHNDEVHFQEELIDGLHFLTEMSILAGYDWEVLNKALMQKLNKKEGGDTLEMAWEFFKIVEEGKGTYIEVLLMHLILELGMTCNCLKNKPWKQTNMLTDIPMFYAQFTKAWLSYLHLLSKYMTPDEVTNVYLKKSQVNKFRQRSNY